MHSKLVLPLVLFSIWTKSNLSKYKVQFLVCCVILFAACTCCSSKEHLKAYKLHWFAAKHQPLSCWQYKCKTIRCLKTPSQFLQVLSLYSKRFLSNVLLLSWTSMKQLSICLQFPLWEHWTCRGFLFISSEWRRPLSRTFSL